MPPDLQHGLENIHQILAPDSENTLLFLEKKSHTDTAGGYSHSIIKNTFKNRSRTIPSFTFTQS